jgi:FkbM family methyltransferase
MFKRILKEGYYLVAKYPLLYPFLFKVLENKKYLELTFHKMIQERAEKKGFFFIQIGANDGKKFDPMYLYVKKYHWAGILIEPVDYVFNKLKENYKGIKDISFENVAIGEKNGTSIFYTLRKEDNKDLPLWYDEIGSFFKANLLKHRDRIKELDKKIVEQEVVVSTLKSVCVKNKVTNVDLLVIDTEGYDYHIIKQLPLLSFKPQMIIFETRHLTQIEKKKCGSILKKLNYRIIEGLDTLAYLP